MVKAWKAHDLNQPSFPSDFEIETRAVLQLTDISSKNSNKYYGIELHVTVGAARIFTHYGRTDDLETKGSSAGVKECRHFLSVSSAMSEYQRLLKSKKRKGYKEVNLASSNIGSEKAKGTSSGKVDAQTVAKIEENDTPKKAKPKKGPELDPKLASLIGYLYNDATKSLTSTVQAKITAKGIETPLGVLTIGQIEDGEALLKQIFDKIKAGQDTSNLTGQFYSTIPHRIGRSASAVQAALIRKKTQIAEKEETLQLMRDMLSVNGEAGGAVLFQDDLHSKYQALGCQVEPVEGALFKEMTDVVVNSQVRGQKIKVRSIYKVHRQVEADNFRDEVGNVKTLFHGSRMRNWVGILSRGILLPKLVVASGGSRTDSGWLGHGIYFGDAACTTVFYTSPGSKGTRFLTIARVALGRIKRYTKRMYGMTQPPNGYHSCHGVPGSSSDFSDNELVIYSQDQQMLQYLVEFST